MPEVVAPQDVGFPIAWWLGWFVVASFVYGLLAIWFLRAGRRHDQTMTKREGA